jgi:copper chaperone
MKTLKFKTNINCNGCITKVTPSLNGAEGIDKWEVDTNNPQKILTIQTASLSEADIITVVKNAGYQAVGLND